MNIFLNPGSAGFMPAAFSCILASLFESFKRCYSVHVGIEVVTLPLMNCHRKPVRLFPVYGTHHSFLGVHGIWILLFIKNKNIKTD